jgi:hypothetical protein
MKEIRKKIIEKKIRFYYKSTYNYDEMKGKFLLWSSLRRLGFVVVSFFFALKLTLESVQKKIKNKIN